MLVRRNYCASAAITMALVTGCAHAQAEDNSFAHDDRGSTRLEAAGRNVPLNGTCAKVNRDALILAAEDRFVDAANLVSAAISNSVHLDHICAGVTMNNLAALMLASGRFAEAEVMAERSVRTLDRSIPPDDPALLRPLQTLAAARFDQGKIARAREAFNRMQSIRTMRPEDRALVSAMAAALLEAQGRLPQAATQYSAAMQALKDARRGDTADAGDLLNGMGTLYIREGRMDEARQVLNDALAIFERAADATPWDRIKVLDTRGTLCARQGKWEEAERDLASALSIADHEPSADPMVLRSLLVDYEMVLRKNHRKRDTRLIERRIRSLGEAIEDRDVVDLSRLLRPPTIR